MSEIIQVIGYVRESTDKQILETDGIEIQKERIVQFCEKNGYKLIGIIPDEGVSGAKDITERPGMLKLLEYSKNPPIKYVVVDKVDRFSRDIYQALFIKKELMKNNVKVLYSAQETLNSNNMMTEMMEQIMMVFAEFERKMINKRTLDGMNNKAKNGNKPVGRQPFGYEWSFDKIKKTTQVNEAQAVIVREMFDMRAGGAILKDIVKHLNKSKTLKKYQDAYTGYYENHVWKIETVRKMLKNDYYIGKVTHAGEKIDGNHQAIVSMDIWDVVNKDR